MTLDRIIKNFDNLKIRKVRGESCWRVYDLKYDMRRECIAEFDSKKDAVWFVMKRATSNY